jgi:hypothetical protein
MLMPEPFTLAAGREFAGVYWQNYGRYRTYAVTTTIEQIAFDRSRQASVAQMAAYLQDLFGQKVTAAMVGVEHPDSVGSWARGEGAPDGDIERRLRDAFRIATLLAQAETRDTLQAWFLGMNPALDDQAPAELIASDPVRVLQAARAFLAVG